MNNIALPANGAAVPFVKEAKRLKTVLIKEHPDYKLVRRKTKKDNKHCNGLAAAQKNEGLQQASSD